MELLIEPLDDPETVKYNFPNGWTIGKPILSLL